MTAPVIAPCCASVRSSALQSQRPAGPHRRRLAAHLERDDVDASTGSSRRVGRRGGPVGRGDRGGAHDVAAAAAWTATSPSVGAERGAERVGARRVRDGRQPAGRSVLEAAPARVGRRRRGDAGRVRGAVAGSVLPGPRRRRRRPRRRPRPSCTRRCPISPTWICGWSATTSPRPTSKDRHDPSDRFPSKAFGYSRDHRSDRPQVVIGLLCTGDGIPIAHHVFAGNTADVSTLPGVLADLQAPVRGRADLRRRRPRPDLRRQRRSRRRTRLRSRPGHPAAPRPDLRRSAHRSDRTRRRVGAGPRRQLAPPATSPWPTGAAPSSSPAPNGTAATRSAPPSSSPAPRPSCSALEDRVRAGRLVDAGKIGRAAQRILGPSGVGRLFDVEIAEGRFLYHYNDAAFAYEELLAGRYVLVTSPHRRPGLHRPRRRRLPPTAITSSTASGCSRTSCTCARCGTGPNDASTATSPCASTPPSSKRSSPAPSPPPTSATPTSPTSTSPPPAPCANSARIRAVTLDAGDRHVDVVTRRTPLQARILAALGVDTAGWDRAHIT